MANKYYKIIVIGLLLTILQVCKPDKNVTQLSQYDKYLLPKDIIPIRYYIRLTPHMHNEAFKGYIQILIQVINSTNNITLHQCGLKISADKISLMPKSGPNESKKLIKHIGISELDQEQFYIIHFENKLETGLYELIVPQYFGQYGIYCTKGLCSHTYPNNNISERFVTSYFQPTFARNAFPCFDEPALKATFKIFIIRPWDYHSASNGILINTKYLHNLLFEDEFEETPKLSTYTIAFFISKLAISPKEAGSIHQMIASNSYLKGNDEKSALTLANQAYKELAKFLNYELPLKKIYHAAIPENTIILANWGLITYGESSLFISNEVTTFYFEQLTDTIVHQLGHLWFGNLVTCALWDYAWINEGFATYLTYHTANDFSSSFNLMDVFQYEVIRIMSRDSKNSTKSLNHRCNPSQINVLKINDLTLIKGAAIIRMMKGILSTKIFRRGLHKFLIDWQFNSVTPDDLYNSFDAVIGEVNFRMPHSFSHVMKTWDSQIGYPIVEVTRNYGLEIAKVHLKQKRCMIDDYLQPKPIWYIPINYATKQNPNFFDDKVTYWLYNKSQYLKIRDLQRTDDWLIINKKASYYYRVNYDLRNWDLLSKALRQNHIEINVRNRAQLIDDAFSLASMGKIPYRIPFQISEYLEEENEYVPLKVMKRIFNTLNFKIRSTDTEEYFRIFFSKIVLGIYNHIADRHISLTGYANNKTHELIFTWLCELQHEKCTSKVQAIYEDFVNGTNQLFRYNNYQKDRIICTVMERVKEHQWNHVFQKFKSTVQQSNNMYFTLACTKNEEQLNKILRYSFNSSDADEPINAIKEVAKQIPIGSRMILKLLSNNFIELVERFGNKTIENIIRQLGSTITHKSDLETLTYLYTKHQKEYKNLFKAGILRANENIQWCDKYLDDIQAYLENYARSGTAECYTIDLIFVLVMFYLSTGILQY